MKLQLSLYAAAAFFLVVAGPAPAQETLQELTHRGLDLSGDFAQSGLSVDALDVAIGPQTMTLKYRFANPTTAPVRTLLALPLPDLDYADPDAAYAIPAPDPVNFIGLAAKVDGRPAAFDFSQTARVDGRNIDALLRRHNLSLIPVGEFHNQLAALAPEARARLAKDGLIAEIGTDAVGAPLYAPRWLTQTRATRSLELAPAQSVSVELRLRTSLGLSRDTPLREPLRSDRGLASAVAARRGDYCLDAAFIGGIDKIVAAAAPLPAPPPLVAPASEDFATPQPAPTSPPLRVFPEANVANLREWRFAFDLGAAAPLAPIRSFRLVVDKGGADRLVSFCLDKLKKISPTGFELRKTDFTPAGALKILLVGRADASARPTPRSSAKPPAARGAD